jgi:two-component system cell cycle sensor histidine kinase/response regulator CckA
MTGTKPTYDELLARVAQLEGRQSSEQASSLAATKDALRGREHVLADLLESTLFGYWDWNISAQTWYLSPALKSMVGYEDDELPSSPDTLPSLIFQEDLPGATEALDRHTRSHGREPYRPEVRYRHKDGSTVWLLCTGRVVEWAEDGSPVRMVGCHVDMTARKQAEEAQREKEEQFRLLFNSSCDAILVHEFATGQLPGLFIEANEEACRRYGYSHAELLGMSPLDLDAPEGLAAIPLAMERLKANGRATWEGKHVTRDGRTIDVEIANVLFQFRGKQMAMASARDITERKRVQKEKYNLEAQLLQAQRMEAVGQLAGGIAHDFNNIVAAMVAELNTLRLEPTIPPEELRRRAEGLLESAKRATNLTRQLLLFSRRQVMNSARHDANVIVRETMRFLGRLLGEPITLTVQLFDEPLWIQADLGMVEQLMANLCVNARDAMPEGGRLSVGVHAVDFDAQATERHVEARSGPFVCLRVSDTGCGMAPAVLHHIFEPFFTTKDQGRGTGLGLPAVQGIVARHGGWVEVETQVGKGSTFSVYLPRAGRAAAPEPKPAS